MIIKQLNRRICPQGATRGETRRWTFLCNWTFVTRELLDAAHIIPDNMPKGKSTIENGLSLCKLHHSAYDAFVIGVTPDYIIQVRADILEEDPLCPSDISPKCDNKNLE